MPTLTFCCAPSIALNQIPPTRQLQHIAQLNEPPDPLNTPHTPLCCVTQPCRPVLLGGRIPPIPPKLAKKIVKGHYVDMAELRPEYLEELNAIEEDHPKSSRPKPKEFTNILEWVQAFSIYVAILSHDQPHRVPSLLAYQHLLIHSHTNFKQFNWVSYDRQFRQKASACPKLDWSTMDGTLWNLCRTEGPTSQTSYRFQPPSYKSIPICLEWNDYPSGCSRNNCCYDHICYRCVNLPSRVDRRHRAISCPNKAKEPQPATYKPGYPPKHPSVSSSRQ